MPIIHHRELALRTSCLAILVALAAAAPPAAIAQPTEDLREWDETFAITLPPSAQPAKQPRLVPSQRLRLGPQDAPQVVLSVLDNEALLREDALAGPERKVLRVSVARAVTLEGLDGDWQALPGGGGLWVADLVSPGALGLRLHLAGLRLPAGAELAIYPEELAATPGLSTASPAVELLTGGASGDRWTRTFGGERARLEYFTPTPDEPLPFQVDALQHVYRDLAALQPWAKAAGPCHNDAACFPELADLAAGVGMLGFIGSSGGGFCTGQLLNSKKQDFTPYFLTANHCLASPGEAASVEVVWFYQPTACNAAPPSLNDLPRSLGTTLLSTGTPSDYTLLMVEGVVPPGTAWLGWTSRPVPNQTPVVAVHHPAGDFKRISFGVKGAGTPLCGGFAVPKHVKVEWTDGPTEPGSSGSGVFRLDTRQLFGQLHCGPSSCGNETYDAYGSFSTTYPRIRKLLAGGSDDRSDPNDSCPRARRVRTGTLTGRIVKAQDEDWYRIRVRPGQTVRVEISFAHARGDVDLEQFPRCGEEPFVVSRGSGDLEAIEVTNSGSTPADARWRVFLADDTRNSYEMRVSLH